jgi:hypothetical protein
MHAVNGTHRSWENLWPPMAVVGDDLIVCLETRNSPGLDLTIEQRDLRRLVETALAGPSLELRRAVLDALREALAEL